MDARTTPGFRLPLTPTRTRFSSPWYHDTSANPPGCADGARLTMFSTPDDAFLPNSVPCGPRSTSMRSMSSRSSVAWPGRAYTTPSTTVETVGSTPGDVEMVPMPRTKIVESLLPPCWRNVALGISCTTVSMAVRLLRSSCSPSTTDTAMGTDCSEAERRVAVTVTLGMLAAMVSLAGSSGGTSAAIASAVPSSRPVPAAAWIQVFFLF
jgi:hypothetical protein